VLSRVLEKDDWDSFGPPPEKIESNGDAQKSRSSGQSRSWGPHQWPVQVPVAGGRLSLPGQVLYWPTHRSFTGEPLAELHLPGSPPLLNEILARVLVCGARPAQRGEFTLRAFLAGRIDLVQAEAVLGVIDATDAEELQMALSQLAGGISSRLMSLREDLLLHLADLEAGLDFVEEDIEFVQRDELRDRLHFARELVAALLEQAAGRMLARDRMKVVLAGLPNAGKSTLFNRLVGQQAALVSAVAGTTRDYLSGLVTHAGTSFELIDTAGWEAARNEIEAAAGALRNDQLQRAHLVVWCSARDLSPTERTEDRSLREECLAENRCLLDVQTKGDAAPFDRSPKNQASTPCQRLNEGGATAESSPLPEMALHPPGGLEDDRPLVISAEQGIGLEKLLAEIVARLSTTPSNSEMIGTTAARCEESLQHSLQGLERAIDAVDAGAGDELIALELREVLDHLGRMMGRIYTDDILDRIFSRFCIGK